MPKRKRKKKGMIIEVTKMGVGMGVGSEVMSRLPGTAGTSTLPIRRGLVSGAGFVGSGVNVMGAGMVIKKLKKLKRRKK